MRIVLFCHSLLSDWNHKSAHFLRGVVTELVSRGHDVRVYEPRNAWSVQNLVRDHGSPALVMTSSAYPAIRTVRYDLESLDLEEALDGADLVIVHEWNEADLVRWIGARRKAAGSRFTLLFHDTHHRSITDPKSMAHYELGDFDGVLAYSAAIQDGYQRRGWSRRAWVWHEAADIRIFRPMQPDSSRRGDVAWIGNWGGEEGAAELRELLLDPVTDLGLVAKVHGVRYPESACADLASRGIELGGWIPNYRVPYVFAQHTMTVHVSRRPRVQALRGIPAIRVFEALACGVPLISGRWEDREGLFSAGRDFLVARDGAEMREHMRLLLRDDDARRELASRGRETILRRHTCAHRVDELLTIVRSLGTPTTILLPAPAEARP